jgi:signal transduction histidine kinase
MASCDDLHTLEFAKHGVCDPQAFLARIDELHAHPLDSSRDEVALQDGRVLDRYSAPCLSPQGDLYGRVWYFRDVTEEKRLAAALQAQNERLEILNRLKVNFVNAVSHELRAPITSIMGYAEFLEENVSEPPQPLLMDFVEQIQRGAKRLRRLVEDLQNVTLIEAGVFRLKLEQADFATKAREIVGSVLPEVVKAQLRLELDLPEGLPAVCMDPLRVGQVLSNLLANAIKFTPIGGLVRVTARLEGDRLRCEVSDNGVGIAPEDISRIFQRYAQLESGLKKGGSGLGLNICKALVEEHSGTIGVHSQLGAGSTFWFELPLTGPAARPQPATPTGAQA